MSYRKKMIQTILLVLLAQASFSAQAVLWKALSGSYGGDDLVFGGAYFEDNVYNGHTYEKVLTAPSDAFPGISPDTPYSFSFINSGVSGRNAPQIDVLSEQADFSSLTLTLWESNNTCVFKFPDCNVEVTSVTLGSIGLIPIINNGNGTFSAVWSTEVIYPGNVQDMSITFAVAPVPIPAAVWLFGSGLLGLIGVARRKA